MKIIVINGSPKANGGLSGQIIEQLERISGEQIKTYQAVNLVQNEAHPEPLADMLSADTLLIVFPLYVDSLPAPLIELLTRLASAANHAPNGSKNKPHVYAVVNCGFYEAAQTRLALTMVQHFANRAGLTWGYGVGIGCGPMLSSIGNDWSKGLAANVHKALRDLMDAARQSSPGEDVFTRPKFPRALYKTAAHMSWRRLAEKNGAGNRLRAKPYA